MTDPEPVVWDWQHPEGWPHTPPLAEFLRAYLEDDNLWWVIGCGHHMNLFDAAVEEIVALRAEVARLRAMISAGPTVTGLDLD